MFEELIAQQEQKLLRLGQRFIPNLTLDDLLQPCDYPQLEQNPVFRFEEGVLIGLKTAETAYAAQKAQMRYGES